MEHSKYFPDSFHRVTIKGLCVRDGKVLLLKETPKKSGKWELPGGGLNFGEDLATCLQREIAEETSLKVVKVSSGPMYAWTHRYGPNRRNIDWYYSLVLAYRIELENLEFVSTDECETIDFFSLDELKSTSLNEQTTELPLFFRPEDFNQPFSQP